MVTIQKENFVLSVDIEKTKDYYKTHELCDCVYCRNYYVQIKDSLPRLAAFLDGFGIDIARPDDVFSGVESNDRIEYYNVDYTVCGSVQTMDEHEIAVDDALPTKVTITDDFTCPNEQTGAYFTVSVTGIYLPWVLDEPFPTAVGEKNPLKGFFRRLFNRSR